LQLFLGQFTISFLPLRSNTAAMAAQKQQERLFITGASGYVGSVVTELAIAEGYDVYALSRTETSDAKLRSLGAVPVRGDLTLLDVLRRESAEADVVIHLATAYTLGVGPYEAVMPVDIAAVDAIADALAGTGKPLVVTSGTLSAAADPTGAETTEASPPEPNPINTRIKCEQHALALASRGIRVTGVRLAPYVYGRGGSGVKLFMGMSAQAGSVTCVDGGKNHTTVVHVNDAARRAVQRQRGHRCDGAPNIRRYSCGANGPGAGHFVQGRASADGRDVRVVLEGREQSVWREGGEGIGVAAERHRYLGRD